MCQLSPGSGAIDVAVREYFSVCAYARSIGRQVPPPEEFVRGFPEALRDRVRARVEHLAPDDPEPEAA